MGAPRIQAKLYAYLKQHPGQQFSPAEIATALAHQGKSITWSLQSLCEKHPTTMRREPIGETGRIATYGYRKANGAATTLHPVATVPEQASDNVLITIPIGDNKSATLTFPAARKVYEQLRVMFGGSGGK